MKTSFRHQRIAVAAGLDVDHAGSQLARDGLRAVRAAVVRDNDFATDVTGPERGVHFAHTSGQGLGLIGMTTDTSTSLPGWKGGPTRLRSTAIEFLCLGSER
jgi:hypothetical protein